MAKIKLTKFAVDAAQPQAKAIELRDTVVPGFLAVFNPSAKQMESPMFSCQEGRNEVHWW